MGSKLQASITAMADLFEHGHLMAETDSAQFIDTAADEIRESRARIATLETVLEDLRDLYGVHKTAWRNIVWDVDPSGAGAVWTAALEAVAESEKGTKK